ncbi:hypothetical protein OAI07_00305 [Akkermansiaceae bacterium]|nr:hypothetical protein [Akkermansiaceae bacterium]
MKRPSFIHSPSIVLITSILLLALGHADVLTLKDDDILTGSVSSIIDDSLTLQSVATENIIQVKTDALKAINFSNPNPVPLSHSELVTLKNGDLIPCSISSLNEKNLNIDTWFAGTLRIPRTSLSTVQFGITQPTIIFNDDPNLSDWEIERGQWDVVTETTHGITKKYYECLSRGSIAKKIETPNNIHIRYDLKWNTSINFTFKFCADNKGAEAKQSAYKLFINYDGVQITRHLNGSEKNLLNSHIKINDLQDKKIRVSIHLNKESGEIHTSINDKLIDTTSYDKITPVDGHYMIFNIGSGDGSRISNFKITESTLTKNHSIQINSLSDVSDLLIDQESNQLEGGIQFIKNNPSTGKSIISFRPKGATDQALEIPESRINALYFGRVDDDELIEKPSIKATTVDKGVIHFNDLKIIDQKIIGKHSDLGDCEMDLKALLSIQYLQTSSQ